MSMRALGLADFVGFLGPIGHVSSISRTSRTTECTLQIDPGPTEHGFWESTELIPGDSFNPAEHKVERKPKPCEPVGRFLGMPLEAGLEWESKVRPGDT